MLFVGKGAGVGALLGVVFVAVLPSVASLQPTAAPEAREESLGAFAFLVAVPIDWALIGAVVGAIIWVRSGRAVASVNAWPRKRI